MNRNNNFRKGRCRECLKNNVYVDPEEVCLKCCLSDMRSEIQTDIKQRGLKAVQIDWEKEKTAIKNLRNEVKETEEWKNSTPQEQKENEKMFNEFLETIDNEIYPNRKRNKIIIWSVVIVVIIVAIGVAIWFFYGRKKEENY